MKIFSKIFVIFFLLVIFIYVSSITTIPENIILFQGEKLDIKTLLGINILQKEAYDTMQTSTNMGNTISETSENVGKTDLSLNLFNNIKLKNVTLNVIPKTKVIPIGQTIGIKLYTKGILVVGISEIYEQEDKEKQIEIKEGDTILTINDKQISSTDELVKTVNESNGKDVKITFNSEGEVKVANIKPSKGEEGTYKLGLWVRDAAAGVGTISFYEPSTKNFAALGHGIQDIDTGKLITIANGEAVTASIIDVVKGEKGKPRRNTWKHNLWPNNRKYL